MKLTGKQQAFIDFYLGEAKFNATVAARLAGYAGNDNTLAQTGFKLVRNGNIEEAIKTRLKERAMSADEVLQRLADEARGDISIFLIPGTTVIDEDKVHQYGHLIKSLTHTKYGPRIELYDAQAAKVHLGKHYKLFTDQVDIDHKGLEALEGWLTELRGKGNGE